MRNDYNKKKRIAIITLSVLVVFLAGSLYWYMGTLENTQMSVVQSESQTEPERLIAVPEIKPESTIESSTSVPEPVSELETASESKTTSEPETSSTVGTVTSDVQLKRSAGKPKSPKEATSPAEPPEEILESSAQVENPDVNGQCQPEHTPQPEANQPQGGEKQDGKIYVPGFGWIEDEGGGSDVHEAPNAGTGEPIGSM